MSGLQISVGALHISISTAVAVVGILGLTAVALGPTLRPVLAERPSPTATRTPEPSPTLTAAPTSTATVTPSRTATAAATTTATPSPTPLPTATPTSIATPLPTATPIPALSCGDASRIVRGHHRTIFDLLDVAAAGVAYSCGAPTGDAQRPVTASWDFGGKRHAATWLVSREGNVTAENDTARTFERMGSLGDLLR